MKSTQKRPKRKVRKPERQVFISVSKAKIATLALVDRDLWTTDFLPIPRAAMQTLGPASQTLAAVIRLCQSVKSRRIYASIERIAKLACLPYRTVKRHLDALVQGGWLRKVGRELLPGSERRTRRTVTYELTKQTLDGMTPFCPLPRAIAANIRNFSVCAVLAFLGSQFLQAEIANGDYEPDNDDEYGYEETRGFMKVKSVIEHTGLCRNSFKAARAWLKDRRAIFGTPYDTDRGICERIYFNEDAGLDASSAPARGEADISGCRTVCLDGRAKDAIKAQRARKQRVKSGIDPRSNVANTPGQEWQGTGSKVASTPVNSGIDPGQKWPSSLREPVTETALENSPEKPAEKNPGREHAASAARPGVCVSEVSADELESRRQRWLADLRAMQRLEAPETTEKATA